MLKFEDWLESVEQGNLILNIYIYLENNNKNRAWVSNLGQ
jgi:hypothetical protein